MQQRGLATAADERHVMAFVAITVEQAEVTSEIITVDGRHRHRTSSTSMLEGPWGVMNVGEAT